MKTNVCSGKNGSILVMTLVLLIISCLIIGALAVFTSTNSGNLRATIAREQAFYLADAGLRCAMNQMVNDQSGIFSKQSSRAFFSDTSMFGDGDWGFSTAIYNVSGRTNRLVSGGFFDGDQETAEVGCVDTSEDIYLNFIYRLVFYSGKIGGLFKVGGTGDLADFVNGDGYVRGSIQVAGDARLRHGELDENDNGVLELGEIWDNAYAVGALGSMTQAEFDAYSASVSPYMNLFYNNGEYDSGEAFVDSIGNGIYDENEAFTDVNGDGQYTPGNTVITPGNGTWDAGENWVDDSLYGRNNNRYDRAGGYYNSQGRWKTTYKVGKKTYSCASWPAEAFEDQGSTVDIPPEPFVDRNGVYDEGEEYLDDRNDAFDWGTMASGTITGMDYGDDSLGIRDALGGNPIIEPPDLVSMYYDRPKTGSTPAFAAEGWGHDVAVTAADYSANQYAVLTTSSPEHIFIRNPSTSSDKSVGGVTIRARSYSAVYYTNSVGTKVRIDDYFLEDPTDSTYNNPSSSGEIGSAGSKTYPMYLNVTADGNEKVYYVDGNLYIHSPVAYSLRFKTPGTKITIVARGNITISDEFYYNADYDEDLQYDDINSTIVKNAEDTLCLIALKNPAVPGNSGNIRIGDLQFGTGGSIHAMMYAENDFIDNNLGGSGQSFISIYGNMAAGGELAIKRAVNDWTRLDITMDSRLSRGSVVVNGLPPAPAGSVFIGNNGLPDWEIVPGTWKSASVMDQ